MFGDYPQVMKKNVGSRLPSFSKVQSELIKGSLDFIGINHYYSLYVNDRPLETGVRDYNTDMSVDSRGKYPFWMLILRLGCLTAHSRVLCGCAI